MLLASWLLGMLLKLAVGGTGFAATAAVASLVNDSLFPASSLKVTRTLMVLPFWLDVRVMLEPVAPGMSDPPAIHWVAD